MDNVEMYKSITFASKVKRALVVYTLHHKHCLLNLKMKQKAHNIFSFCGPTDLIWMSVIYLFFKMQKEDHSKKKSVFYKNYHFCFIVSTSDIFITKT